MIALIAMIVSHANEQKKSDGSTDGLIIFWRKPFRPHP